MEHTGPRCVSPVLARHVRGRADAPTSPSLGRFLREYTADDILFGNIFDRPFKLPWGFSAALKFMKYVPPGVPLLSHS